MTEDNMEISYDDHGDDDIDINIDIDQDNHDDDYMIEDAHSDAGTNDDVMVDEDNTSFAMEDDDYMPDHTLEDIQPEIVEVTEIEMTRITEAEAEETIDDPFAPSDPLEDQQHVEVHEVDASQTVKAPPSASTPTDTIDHSALPVAAPASINDPSHEPPASPRKVPLSEEVSESNIAPPSPPKSVQLEQGDGGTEESSVQPTPEQELASDERIIMVHYNDQEYALVCSSESDDPDTYFLKDSHVLQEPLSIFFACLREILGDEVSPQDELCLAIDDLGLETFETCLSNNDVTFSQLVNVHTTLLRNDGRTEVPPLYITLSTKPEFRRTLEKMIEDAKSGHGLNEIMEIWDADEETDWAGSEHGHEGETSGVDDDYYDENENYDDPQTAENEPSAGEKTVEENENQHPDEKPAAAQKETLSEQADQLNEAATEPTEDDDAPDPSAQEQPTETEAIQGKESSGSEAVVKPALEAEKPGSKQHDLHDEEDDLIDYEDDDYSPAMMEAKAASQAASRRASHSEEDLASPCLRPKSCFCSSCNKRLLAEYAEINEKMDQSRRSSRSSSRTLEESNGDTAGKSSDEGNTNIAIEPAEDDVSTVVSVEEQDQNEYNGTYADDDQQEIGQEGYEEIDDTVHTEEDGHYENEDQEYTNFQEEPSENQPIEQQKGQPEISVADDATLQTGGDGETQDQSVLQETAITEDVTTEQPAEVVEIQDEDEISYEDEDEAPQETETPVAGADAKEPALVVEASVPEDHEDEIDYDDDDRAEAHTLESEPVEAASPSSAGKRPRDEPDALDLNSQDAKRVRA